jgi:hypothetical protein
MDGNDDIQSGLGDYIGSLCRELGILHIAYWIAYVYAR